MTAFALALVLFAAPDAASPRPALPWTSLTSTVRDSLTFYYAQQDTSGIERLYRRRARTREERLLCLYRLFPMTLDRAYLRDIPSEAGLSDARELALIAAMWGFRATSGPVYRLPRDGRRSERILGQALVRGQTLYYKPRAFGGDVAEARRTFERLRTVLARRPTPGLHPFEAEVWIWLCVRRTDRTAGARLQQTLLARRPPPIFRQFLVDPP